MAKFCANCGTALEEKEVFCPICGTKRAPDGAANPQTPPSAVHVAETQKSSKLPFILGMIAVVAVALSVVLVLFKGIGYNKALNTFFDVINGDFSNIEDMAPPEVWEYVEDKNDDFDMDEMDGYIEEAEEKYEDLLENLEDKYGEGIEISYEVTGEEEISRKDLKKIANKLEDKYDIDKDDVTKGYALEIEVAIEGDDDSDDSDFEVAAIKIDGSWYLIRSSGSSVSFPVG